MPHQEHQQVELPDRQGELYRAQPGHPAADVHPQRPVGERLRSVTEARRATVVPAQHGLHPQHQLPGRERLGHVVVRAELQAEHPVRLLAERGQHHDRHPVRAGPQPPADLQAIDHGQHQVEYDEVGLVAGDRGERGRAVTGVRHQVPGPFQVPAHHVADRPVVVDDEHPLPHRVQDSDGSARHIFLNPYRLRQSVPAAGRPDLP